MSVEHPLPRKASIFDIKALMTFAITGLLGCFFLTYTAQIKMGEALLMATEIQKQNIEVLKKHDSMLNEQGTWMRVTEIRLSMIEKSLGLESPQRKSGY